MVSGCAWWDPAFGSGNGDNSVLACVFFDNQGNAYVHDIVYLTVENKEKAAEIQCQKVADIIKTYHLPQIRIETNGIGKFLPELLKKTLQEQRIVCAVLPMHSHTPKALRISEAFDARLANHSLFFHAKLKSTPIMEEMNSWNPENKNMHDDGLDALAGCLLSEPVRLVRHFSSTKKHIDWRYGSSVGTLDLRDIKI